MESSQIQYYVMSHLFPTDFISYNQCKPSPCHITTPLKHFDSIMFHMWGKGSIMKNISAHLSKWPCLAVAMNGAKNQQPNIMACKTSPQTASSMLQVFCKEWQTSATGGCENGRLLDSSKDTWAPTSKCSQATSGIGWTTIIKLESNIDYSKCTLKILVIC